MLLCHYSMSPLNLLGIRLFIYTYLLLAKNKFKTSANTANNNLEVLMNKLLSFGVEEILEVLADLKGTRSRHKISLTDVNTQQHRRPGPTTTTHTTAQSEGSQKQDAAASNRDTLGGK